MKLKRITGALVVASLGLIGLTACDPPYPPELIETIYEQNPVCEPGAVKILAQDNLEQLIAPFNDTMVGLCPDMSIEASVEEHSIRLTVNADSAIGNQVYAATPLYVDAGVAVINFSSGVNLNLTLDVLFKILSGEISNWNDPAVTALNKGTEVIDMPITVNPESDSSALQALKNWAALAEIAVPDSLLTEGIATPTIDLYATTEGTITILPLSSVLNQGLTPCPIKVASKNLNATVSPNDSSVYAGASQFVAKDVDGILKLTQDPTLEPEMPKGAETTDKPYQAVFFGWMVLEGNDNLLDRSVGRFLLRMDEQGTLPSVSLIGLPSKIRQAATKLVSKGLTLPKVEIKK